MGSHQRVAPIFPVRDLDTSLAPYAPLGFETRKYEGGGHGFATAEGIEPRDAVAARWVAAGAEVHRPVDTEWGQHEGAVVDPDGNGIDFGSPRGF